MLEEIWNAIIATPYGLLAIVILLAGIVAGLAVLMIIGRWRQTEKRDLVYVLYSLVAAVVFVVMSRLIFFNGGQFHPFHFWPGILLTLLCVVVGVGVALVLGLLWLFFGMVEDRPKGRENI